MVAWYRVRAAAALGAGGEHDVAAGELSHAYRIVSATGNGKTLTEIANVYAALAAKWPTRPAITELGRQITEI
jgi:hypothetical protein